jgi:metal-responsive CopG/Arc/MetJ family transcriptional regulator
MHTITLKSDDNFFDMLNDMVKSLNTNRSDLIRKAVLHYRDSLEKEKLKMQIQKASLRVRQESLEISQEFDDSVDDGLKHV